MTQLDAFAAGISSREENLQVALDVLNAEKFRELSQRALSVGMVLALSLNDTDDPDLAEFEGGPLDIGRFTRPLHERLAAIEALIEAEEAI